MWLSLRELLLISSLGAYIIFRVVFEIFDISVDISAIYRILVPIETIFAIENRLVEKS